MTHASPHFLRMALLAGAIGACSEPLPDRPVTAQPAAHDIEVLLTTSDRAPAPGDTAVITVRVRRATGVARVGSYMARLTYDAARLAFIDVPGDDGRGLRIANGDVAGEVRAAGAAPTGFDDDALVELRFIVRTAEPFEGMRLALDDFRGPDGSDLSRARIVPGIGAPEAP